MRLRISVFTSVFSMCVVPLVVAQTDTTIQARSVLQQALDASGYTSNPIPGFTASGTITYFGGGKQQIGPAAIKARGYDQFRIDSTLPSGVRTISFNRSSGTRKEPNGRSVELPAHSGLASVNPLFPYAALANALASTDFTARYVGLVQEGSRQFHQVRTRRIITRAQDPSGMVEDLTQVDYFIDSQTRQIARIQSIATATTNMLERFPQVIELESYAGKNGIAVPTLIRLKLSGATVWELQLSDLRASASLVDGDFMVQ